MWHHDQRIRWWLPSVMPTHRFPLQSASPGPPTGLTNTVSQENQGYRVQADLFSRVLNNWPHRVPFLGITPQCQTLVGIPFSVFFFASFTGDRGRKGLCWKKNSPGISSGNPVLSSEEKIPQRLIYFTEAHIGYREWGVVLAWPVPRSSTAFLAGTE